MNGLNLGQEAALAYAWMNQDSNSKNFSGLGISKAFIDLNDLEMIKMQTGWGDNLVMFQSMRQAGSKHYDEARKARRKYKVVSDEADCLMMRLAVQDAEKRKSEDGPIFVSADIDKDTYYAELARCGLLDVQWADDSPYCVSVTDEGRKYVNGWSKEQMDNEDKKINFAPVINNNVSAISNSKSEISDVTIGTAIGKLADLNIDKDLKNNLQEVVKQLANAAKERDKKKFSEKLETVASFAKSPIDIANIVLPFVFTVMKSLIN